MSLASTLIKVNQLMIVLLIGVILIVVHKELFAQDDFTCASYANLAIRQNEENIKNELNLSGPEWSSDYQYHFRRCMTNGGEVSKMEAIKRAEILNKHGANPCCDINMAVNINFNNILVLDEADGVTPHSEPYLWLFFFKLDSDYLLSRDCDNWFYAPDGSFGNIGEHWGQGDNIPIPAEIGRWSTSLSRFAGKGKEITEKNTSLFVIMIMIEHDDQPKPDKIKNEYHPMFVKRLEGLIQETIRELDYNMWFIVGIDQNRELLENRLRAEFVDAFSHPDELWAINAVLFLGMPIAHAAVNIDDYIGSKILYWSWEDLQREPSQIIHFPFNPTTGSKDGSYLVDGNINAHIDCSFDYIPSKTCAFKVITDDNHQYYWCSEYGKIIADRTEIREWETFALIYHNINTVSIRDHEFKYISAINGGGSGLTTKNCIDYTCKFEVINLGNNKIALKTLEGHYLSAENGGGAEISAYRPHLKSWETFELIQVE